MNRVLLDTGPLVAMVSERDQYHDVCVEELRRLPSPLLSCWPVITEAAWLLRSDLAAVQRMLAGFDTGLMQLLPLDEQAGPWISAFIGKYASIGAQVADPCLVYLAEREGIDRVFTLDRRVQERSHAGPSGNSCTGAVCCEKARASLSIKLGN